jgi:hypothetical protein
MIPEYQPVKDSGPRNFFKNFWQPWNAPKGERTAPIIGFIAATILFLPLFLPAVGIAALIKRVAKPIKESAPHVQDLADRVTNSVENSSTEGSSESSSVSTVSGSEERMNLLQTAKDERQEFLDIMEGLPPEKKTFLETKELLWETLNGLDGIINDLESSIDDSAKFSTFVREFRFQMGRLNPYIEHLDAMMEAAEKEKVEPLEDKSNGRIQELEKDIEESQKALEKAQQDKVKIESKLEAHEQNHSTRLDKDENMADKLVARKRERLREEIKTLERNIDDIQQMIEYYQEEKLKIENE